MTFLTNTGPHLLRVSFITRLTVKFMHSSNRKENNFTISHAQNTTELQPRTFLFEIQVDQKILCAPDDHNTESYK
jgi:hypothetical protein